MIKLRDCPRVVYTEREGSGGRRLSYSEFIETTKLIARFYGVKNAKKFFEKYAEIVL